MNERERLAEEAGDAKVFLSANEVALLHSALRWLATDLKLAKLRAEESGSGNDLRDPVSQLADTYEPVITFTQGGLLAHAIASYDEKNDAIGRDTLQKQVETTAEQMEQIQKMVLTSNQYAMLERLQSD